ncbi:hypothetical protein SUGI_0789950 [Cryptomeria japonica]|nr:hypothetical protein SUGI_0789950 [Cryptomeria japonica]
MPFLSIESDSSPTSSNPRHAVDYNSSLKRSSTQQDENCGWEEANSKCLKSHENVSLEESKQAPHMVYKPVEAQTIKDSPSPIDTPSPNPPVFIPLPTSAFGYVRADETMAWMCVILLAMKKSRDLVVALKKIGTSLDSMNRHMSTHVSRDPLVESQHVTIGEFEGLRDVKQVKCLEKWSEVGPSGKILLFTAFMHDPICCICHAPAFVMFVEELGPAGEIVGLIRDCIRTVYLPTRAEEERAHVEHTVLLRAKDISPSNRPCIAFLFLPGVVVEKLQGVFERLTVHNQLEQCIDVYVDIRGRNGGDSLEALDLDYLDIEFNSVLTVDAWCKDLEFVVKYSLEAEFRSFGEGSVNIEVHEIYSSQDNALQANPNPPMVIRKVLGFSNDNIEKIKYTLGDTREYVEYKNSKREVPGNMSHDLILEYVP